MPPHRQLHISAAGDSQLQVHSAAAGGLGSHCAPLKAGDYAHLSCSTEGPVVKREGSSAPQYTTLLRVPPLLLAFWDSPEQLNRLQPPEPCNLKVSAKLLLAGIVKPVWSRTFTAPTVKGNWPYTVDAVGISLPGITMALKQQGEYTLVLQVGLRGRPVRSGGGASVSMSCQESSLATYSAHHHPSY